MDTRKFTIYCTTCTAILRITIGSYSATRCFCCFSPSLVWIYVNSRFDSSQLPPLWTLKVHYLIYNSRILDPSVSQVDSVHTHILQYPFQYHTHPCLGRRSGITQLHIFYSIHRTICSSSGYNRSWLNRRWRNLLLSFYRITYQNTSSS